MAEIKAESHGAHAKAYATEVGFKKNRKGTSD
jgi:hypothetical protein